MTKQKDKTYWHLILAKLLHEALEPLGIQVLADVSLLRESPKADILLLRRTGKNWSAAQRQWLADGLRHTDMEHLLIEFKYSEGLTLRAVQQLNAYDYFYCGTNEIEENNVACFLIVASTPQGDWQKELGFSATEWLGVYKGIEILSKRIHILLLNELNNTSYNAPLKCFATKRKERDKALTALVNSGFINLSAQIYSIIAGLRRTYMSNVAIPKELTPEVIMEMGREFIDAMMKTAPIEDFLKFHQPDEILSYYKPDDVLSYYKPYEILSHYKPDERMADLTDEEINAYLERRRQKNQH